MRRDQVRRPAEAWVYMLDCTLATVSHLAMLAWPPKHELARQTSIAQQAIGWMNEMGIDYSTTRAAEVQKDFGGSVEAWAKAHRA